MASPRCCCRRLDLGLPSSQGQLLRSLQPPLADAPRPAHGLLGVVGVGVACPALVMGRHATLRALRLAAWQVQLLHLSLMQHVLVERRAQGGAGGAELAVGRAGALCPGWLRRRRPAELAPLLLQLAQGGRDAHAARRLLPSQLHRLRCQHCLHHILRALSAERAQPWQSQRLR